MENLNVTPFRKRVEEIRAARERARLDKQREKLLLEGRNPVDESEPYLLTKEDMVEEAPYLLEQDAIIPPDTEPTPLEEHEVVEKGLAPFLLDSNTEWHMGAEQEVTRHEKEAELLNKVAEFTLVTEGVTLPEFLEHSAHVKESSLPEESWKTWITKRRVELDQQAQKLGTGVGRFITSIGTSVRDLPGNVANDVQTGVRGVAKIIRNPLEAYRAAQATELTVTKLILGYNKLPPRQKAYIAAGLIGGSALAAAAALPTFSTMLAGTLYGTRGLAGVGFAVDRRAKIDTNPAHLLANRSRFEKAIYSTALGAIYGVATYWGGRQVINHLTEWLGGAMGHGGVPERPYSTPTPEQHLMAGHTLIDHNPTPTPEAAYTFSPEPSPTDSVVMHSPTPEATPTVTPDATHAPTVDSVMKDTTVPTAEIPASEAVSATEAPSLSVEASAKGYEGMVKQLVKQARAQNLTANAYAEGSDLRRLLEAKPGRALDKLVHDIAIERGFFTDAGSVHIDPAARLTINTDHQLLFSDPAHPHITHAAEDMKIVTPPKIIEPTPRVSADEAVRPSKVFPEGDVQRVSADAPRTAGLEAEPVIVDHLVTHDIETSNSDVGEARGAATSSEVLTGGDGLQVNAAESHIYADKDGSSLFVYGGSSEDRALALDTYFKNPANADKVVYGSESTGTIRYPWRLINGVVVPGAPVAPKGLWNTFKSVFGAGSSLTEAPKPEEFYTLVQ